MACWETPIRRSQQWDLAFARLDELLRTLLLDMLMNVIDGNVFDILVLGGCRHVGNAPSSSQAIIPRSDPAHARDTTDMVGRCVPMRSLHSQGFGRVLEILNRRPR